MGFSGTGKSTVAAILAHALGWSMVDTDQIVVSQFGKSIADVFRDSGEEVFRAAERAVVADACAGRRQVISLGGGVPVDPRNREHLGNRNLVVRLDATPDTILARLRHGPNAEERPMIAGSDPLARITRLLSSRQDAYSVANFRVDTNGRSPSEVAEDVLAWLGRQDILTT